jgi:hypothetical protein
MRCLLPARRRQAGTSLPTTLTRLIQPDVKDCSCHFSRGVDWSERCAPPMSHAEHSPRPNPSTRVFSSISSDLHGVGLVCPNLHSDYQAFSFLAGMSRGSAASHSQNRPQETVRRFEKACEAPFCDTRRAHNSPNLHSGCGALQPISRAQGARPSSGTQICVDRQGGRWVE